MTGFLVEMGGMVYREHNSFFLKQQRICWSGISGECGDVGAVIISGVTL